MKKIASLLFITALVSTSLTLAMTNRTKKHKVGAELAQNLLEIAEPLDEKVYILTNCHITISDEELQQVEDLGDIQIKDGDTLKSLRELNILRLHNNQLNSLPNQIGNLTNLLKLWLNNNQLNSLPNEIGNLTKLQELWLYNNQLNSLPN